MSKYASIYVAVLTLPLLIACSKTSPSNDLGGTTTSQSASVSDASQSSSTIEFSLRQIVAAGHNPSDSKTYHWTGKVVSSAIDWQVMTALENRLYRNDFLSFMLPFTNSPNCSSIRPFRAVASLSMPGMVQRKFKSVTQAHWKVRHTPSEDLRGYSEYQSTQGGETFWLATAKDGYVDCGPKDTKCEAGVEIPFERNPSLNVVAMLDTRDIGSSVKIIGEQQACLRSQMTTLVKGSTLIENAAPTSRSPSP